MSILNVTRKNLTKRAAQYKRFSQVQLADLAISDHDITMATQIVYREGGKSRVLKHRNYQGIET